MKIACIGSRSLGHDQLAQCEALGKLVVERGHELHTGNAPGADQAFARGGNAVDPTKVFLHLPWKGFESAAVVRGNVLEVVPGAEEDPGLYDEAAFYHPSRERLSPGAFRLMARNIRIVERALLCLAWPDWKKPGGGGTGQGMRYCARFEIRLISLADPPEGDQARFALAVDAIPYAFGGG